VGNPANLNIRGDYTLELWVSPAVNSSVFGSGWHYLGQKGYRNEFGFYGTSGPQFKFKSTTGSTYSLNARMSFLANEWYHIAAVRNGSFVGLYVNGVLRDSRTTFTGEIDTGSDVQTFGGRNSNGRSWNGRMDEITVYNRGLSAAEIAAIYGAGAAGKCR
jgi:hypothetical protein